MKPLSYSTLTLAQDMLNTLAFAPGGAAQSYRWEDIPQAAIDDATDLLSALCMRHGYDATLLLDDDILQVIHLVPTAFPRMELSHDLEMIGNMLTQTTRMPVLHLYSSIHNRNMYLSHSLLRPARVPHVLNTLLAGMEDGSKELNNFLIPHDVIKEEDYEHITPDNRLPADIVSTLQKNQIFEGTNSKGEGFRSGVYYVLKAPVEDADFTLHEITANKNSPRQEYNRLTALCNYLSEHYALPPAHQHLVQDNTSAPSPIVCVSTPFFDAIQEKLHPRPPSPFIASNTPLQDMQSIIRRGINNTPFLLAKNLLRKMNWDINQSVSIESLRETGVSDASISAAVAIINCVTTLHTMPLEIVRDGDAGLLRITPMANSDITVDHYPWREIAAQIDDFKNTLRQPTPDILLSCKDDKKSLFHLPPANGSNIDGMLAEAMFKTAEKELGVPISNEQYGKMLASMNAYGKVFVNRDSNEKITDSPSDNALCMLHTQYLITYQAPYVGKGSKTDRLYGEKTKSFRRELFLLLESLHIPVDLQDITITQHDNLQDRTSTYGLLLPKTTMLSLRKALGFSSPSEHRMV